MIRWQRRLNANLRKCNILSIDFVRFSSFFERKLILESAIEKALTWQVSVHSLSSIPLWRYSSSFSTSVSSSVRWFQVFWIDASLIQLWLIEIVSSKFKTWWNQPEGTKIVSPLSCVTIKSAVFRNSSSSEYVPKRRSGSASFQKCHNFLPSLNSNYDWPRHPCEAASSFLWCRHKRSDNQNRRNLSSNNIHSASHFGSAPATHKTSYLSSPNANLCNKEHPLILVFQDSSSNHSTAWNCSQSFSNSL